MPEREGVAEGIPRGLYRYHDVLAGTPRCLFGSVRFLTRRCVPSRFCRNATRWPRFLERHRYYELAPLRA